MAMSDEIRARVDAKFQSPEFIGHVLDEYHRRISKRILSHVPSLEGRLGTLMRAYVNSKLDARKYDRMAGELSWSRHYYHGNTMAERAEQKRVDAKNFRAEVTEMLGTVDYT